MSNQVKTVFFSIKTVSYPHPKEYNISTNIVNLLQTKFIKDDENAAVCSRPF